MEGKIKYMPEYDHYFRMSEELVPPPSVYRFKPTGLRVFAATHVTKKLEEQVYLGKDRLIFDGEQRYTTEETRQLQLFFKYVRDKKLQCKEMY